MPTILVATDFSTRSDRGLRRTILIARQSGYEILLINAVDDEQPQRLIDPELREISLLLADLERTIADVDGVKNTTAIRFGRSFEQFVSAAEEASTELIVLGSHRRRLVLDQFQGEHTKKLTPKISVDGNRWLRRSSTAACSASCTS